MANIPTANNNPGDLKNPATGNFQKYSNPQEGMAALLNDLQAKFNGKLGQSGTLADFAKMYAPPTDNNDTAGYTAKLANKLGVRPDTPFKELQPKIAQLADAIAGNEGYQGVSNGNNGSNMMAPPIPPGGTPAAPQTDMLAPPTPPTSVAVGDLADTENIPVGNPWEGASPGENIAKGNSGTNTERSKGAIKGVLQSIRDVSGVDTSPVVKAQLASAPAFAKDIESEKGILKPSNSAQSMGARDSKMAASLIPAAEGAKAGATGIKGILSPMKVGIGAVEKVVKNNPIKSAIAGYIISNLLKNTKAGSAIENATGIKKILDLL